MMDKALDIGSKGMQFLREGGKTFVLGPDLEELRLAHNN